MTDHIENVFKQVQDQIMIISNLRKLEENNKQIEEKGD